MIEDNIVYQARLHWIIFIGPIFFLSIGLFLALNYPLFLIPSLILSGLMLIWLISTWVLYQCSTLTVKLNQVSIRSGFLVRKHIDLPINKIETVDIRQNLLGTIFGYGSLELTGTGGTRELMDYISKPLTCRRYIEQCMHA